MGQKTLNTHPALASRSRPHQSPPQAHAPDAARRSHSHSRSWFPAREPAQSSSHRQAPAAQPSSQLHLRRLAQVAGEPREAPHSRVRHRAKHRALLPPAHVHGERAGTPWQRQHKKPKGVTRVSESVYIALYARDKICVLMHTSYGAMPMHVCPA